MKDWVWHPLYSSRFGGTWLTRRVARSVHQQAWVTAPTLPHVCVLHGSSSLSLPPNLRSGLHHGRTWPQWSWCRS